MRANAIAHGQQEDLERDLLERALDEGGVGDKKELLDAQSSLGYAQLRQANLKMQQEIEAMQQLNDLKREIDNDNVSCALHKNENCYCIQCAHANRITLFCNSHSYYRSHKLLQ